MILKHLNQQYYHIERSDNLKDIIVIVGPTGVGKTKLSIELAKKLDAEIINGDSVSIYKRLDIGSAKPTIEERDNIPHHLIDIKDVNEDYSVYDYQKDIREKIEEISKRNKRIIIVGGTGLYIKAALYDYQFDKEEINNNYEDLSKEELLNRINKYNINLDNIDINNKRRLERLLNKLENNIEIINNKDKLLYNSIFIGLTTDRDILYHRINDRVDKMIDNGLIDEVEGLKDYYNDSRILNSAIGYKEFYDYLFNDKELNDVIEEIKRNSRRFAKRQYTFFNHQFNVDWFEVDFNNFDNTINEVYKKIST